MPFSDVIGCFCSEGAHPKDTKAAKTSSSSINGNRPKATGIRSHLAKDKKASTGCSHQKAKRTFASRISGRFSKSLESVPPSPVSSDPIPESALALGPEHPDAQREAMAVRRVSSCPPPATQFPAPSPKVKPRAANVQPLGHACASFQGPTIVAGEEEGDSQQGNLKSASPPLELKKPSFWKRLSQTTSITPMRSLKKDHLNRDAHEETPQTTPSPNHQDFPYSEEHPSTSSEMSDPPSTFLETAETSIASHDECGLAGIGIRDRSSISLHSLATSHLSPESSAYKTLSRPGMNYAPSNSSPLSSRAHSSEKLHEMKGPAHPSRSRQSSSQLRVKNRESVNHGRLSVVPVQSAATPESLMRMLRGPSSYPDESIPRFNRNSLALNA